MKNSKSFVKSFLFLCSLTILFSFFSTSVFAAEQKVDEDTIITLTTNKKKGETIKIKALTYARGAYRIEGVENFSASKKLEDYKITSNEIRIIGKVNKLECPESGIIAIDLSKAFVNFESLDCNSNNISELDFSEHTKIKELNVSDNNISSLNISILYNLKNLNCSNNRIGNLDLKELQYIKTLNCANNEITELKFHPSSQIEHIDCSNNKIKDLNLSTLMQMKSLSCQENKLQSISIAGFASSFNLIKIYSNNLGEEALSKLFDQLRTIKGTLILVDNQNPNESNTIENEETLKKATDKGWTVYDFNGGKDANGEGSDNGITYVFGSKPKEKEAPRGEPTITFTTDDDEYVSLIIVAKDGAKIEIEGVEESFEEMTEEDEPKDYTLKDKEVKIYGPVKYFYCAENSITKLNLSNNPELETLDCSGNGLSSLNLEKNTKLKTLRCYNNTLTNLDLSKNTALEYINCYGNKITDINFENPSNLKNILLHSNKISFESMQKIVDKMPTIKIAESEKDKKGFFVVADNSDKQNISHINTEQVKALSDKGWKVRDVNSNYNEQGIESEFGIPYEGEKTTAIDEVSTSTIKVYPNPTTSYIIVNGVSYPTMAKIYNIAGELVLEIIVADNSRIDLSKLVPSKYILVLDGKAYQILINK